MNVSIRRILFPTDFSDSAKEAQLYATSLAEHFDAELHVLHVVAPAAPFFVAESPYVPQESTAQFRVSAVEKRLSTELDSEWTQSHHVKHVVVVGVTFDEIVKYADDNQIDLIVVGTHEHSGLYHLMIGSMAEKLVRLGNVPVLTVNSHAPQMLKASSTDQSATEIV